MSAPGALGDALERRLGQVAVVLLHVLQHLDGELGVGLPAVHDGVHLEHVRNDHRRHGATSPQGSRTDMDQRGRFFSHRATIALSCLFIITLPSPPRPACLRRGSCRFQS